MIAEYSVITAAEYPMKVEIYDQWKFKQEGTGQWYPAEVPGCVHTDLLKNGLIPDPFFGVNEHSLQWIGENNWIYETVFNIPAEILKKEVVELVFEGLDTYAEVTLNDSLILKTDNMFRTWRVNCKSILHVQGNRITILFRNVFDENLPKYRSAPFELQAFSNNDQADVKIAMYSRKAQFHYGWDWGPRLITCGIWRPVSIEAWSSFKIKNIHIQQKNVSADGANIVSVINLISDKKQQVTLSIYMDGRKLSTDIIDLLPGINKADVKGHLDNPRLWWTNGLGEQYLYTYHAVVENNSGNQEEYKTKLGIRSVEVVREKDTGGTSMYIRLNGIPVFMKGANYVPQDNFQNRVTKERYEHIIRSAAEAHMNMLRVWGGGIYENDQFYDLCDRYGILVWQEMMFACAMYPGDDEFLANVRNEIVDNIVRIRNHACVALYCGNNENEIGWNQWGWKEMYDKKTQSVFERNSEKLFYNVIPSALHEADSARYYHPTSPSAGFKNIPNGEGDIHYWGVWHGKEPFESFTSNLARFVSEYGFQSYPELSTIEKYAKPDDRQLHSEVMLSHQRCMADERNDKEYGNRLIQRYMDRWYREPKDFSSFVYVNQVLQAEGVKVAMEAHRRAMPYCMGSLYWQIDDSWPVASWSSIDYYGRWKALHYTAKESYAPIIVSPVVSEDSVEFFIVSDILKTVDAVLDISVMKFDGTVVFQQSIPVSVKSDTSYVAASMEKRSLIGEENESGLVLVSRLKKGEEILAEKNTYFESPKDLELKKPEFITMIRGTPSGYAVELMTNTLAKNVYMTCKDDKGFYSDNYFDLLPGVKKLITVSTGLGRIDFEQSLKIISLVDSY